MSIFSRIREAKEKFRSMQSSNKYKVAVRENQRLEAERQRMAKLEAINRQNLEAQKAIRQSQGATETYEKNRTPSLLSRFSSGVNAMQKKSKGNKKKSAKGTVKKAKSGFFQSKPGPFSSMGGAGPGFFEMGRK